MKSYKKSLQAITQLFIPHHCLLCRNRSQYACCKTCEEALPWLEQPCPTCAYPLFHTGVPSLMPCPVCAKQTFDFTRTLSLLHYTPPASKLIKLLKFKGQLGVADWFGLALSRHVLQHYANDVMPQLIIPVPLHPKRLRKRGFNQSTEIARPISKQLGIPMRQNLCKRIKHTQPQTQRSIKQRARNVQQAFTTKPLTATHVAVIDDVMTTGQTTQSLCRSLRKQGVKRVDVWCCARATIRN